MPLFRSSRTRTTGQGVYPADVVPGYMRGIDAQPIRAGTAEGKVRMTKAAQQITAARPVLGRRMAWYILGDLSGSMSPFLPDLDYLTEAVLTAVDVNGWDDDGVVPCFGYANQATSPVMAKLGAHEGVVNELLRLQRDERIGYGTNYTCALQAAVDHYRRSDSWGAAPAVIVLQSDGRNVPHQADTAKLIAACSKDPVHFVLVYFGDVAKPVEPGAAPGDEAASMRELDLGYNMPERKVDNASLFIAGPKPRLVAPAELYEGLVAGVARWLEEAPRAGVRLP